MLSDYFTDQTVRFADGVEGWREAIGLVSQPLLADGSITSRYVEAMTETIAKPGGTYIDLGHGVALAHSRPENGVNRTGVSYLRVRPSVLLADDPKHPIDVFLCLAATDSSGHLGVMRELAALLTDEDRRTRLLEATTVADVTAAIDTNGQNR